VAPKAPIHAEIVEDEEPKGSGKKNVRQNHPQVLLDPSEILKPNCECYDRSYYKRRRVEQEEMPVSQPLWKECCQWCHLLACVGLNDAQVGAAQSQDAFEKPAS
jgi:hypothetical protein